MFGRSDNHEGIHAETNSATTSALAVFHLNQNSDRAALFAKHNGNGPAAVFDGSVIAGDITAVNITVQGDITLANAGADCAEDFDIAVEATADPGTVMVLDDEGNLRECFQAYDRRVAGIISGAGDYRPGIVLGKQHTGRQRAPIALVGKVFCKVDAQYGAVTVGDLLTSSPTPGHAMKASDALRSFGCVIGKSLGGLETGTGMIPVLIALQ